MKRLLRVLLTLLIIFVLAIVALIGFAAADAYAFASGDEYYNLEQPEEFSGYVAQPTEPRGVGVLLLHEWWGLTEDIIRKADLLATHGYVVVAPDLYGGRLARTVPGALMLRLATPAPDISAVADAAFAFLDERVDNGTGVVGFCFGGTQAMELGRRTPQVAATVIFYGSGLITSKEEVGSLGAGGPILGIFGAEDASIPLSEVDAFESALSAAGVDYNVSIYDDVGHAFVEYSRLNDGGPAERAWVEMTTFLRSAVLSEGDE